MWTLTRTAQCAKCPWRVDVDPRTIPNGYSEDQHRALVSTIAQADDVTGQLRASLGPGGPEPLRMMACHETHAAACVGWLSNQLGAGNNIALRLQMLACTNADRLRLRGAQHATFADTLPAPPD